MVSVHEPSKSCMIARRFPERLLLFVLITMVAPTHACLNSFEINPNIGASGRSIVDQLIVHHVTEPWDQRVKRLREKLKPDSDYQTKNDLAVALMHTQASELRKSACSVRIFVENG